MRKYTLSLLCFSIVCFIGAIVHVATCSKHDPKAAQNNPFVVTAKTWGWAKLVETPNKISSVNPERQSEDGIGLTQVKFKMTEGGGIYTALYSEMPGDFITRNWKNGDEVLIATLPGEDGTTGRPTTTFVVIDYRQKRQ